MLNLSTTSPTVGAPSNSYGPALTTTEIIPIGAVALSREAPAPEIKNRPLHLPLSYYYRMAAEQRLLQQSLLEMANKRVQPPR